jgi:hypothetical protein
MTCFIESAMSRNFAPGRIVAFWEGSGRVVSAAGDKREREQLPTNKMTREEAEHLRELLRGTKPADLVEPSVLQRIGRAIARAVSRPSKRGW